MENVPRCMTHIVATHDTLENFNSEHNSVSNKITPWSKASTCFLHGGFTWFDLIYKEATTTSCILMKALAKVHVLVAAQSAQSWCVTSEVNMKKIYH